MKAAVTPRQALAVLVVYEELVKALAASNNEMLARLEAEGSANAAQGDVLAEWAKVCNDLCAGHAAAIERLVADQRLGAPLVN